MQLITDDLTLLISISFLFLLVWNNIKDRDQLNKFFATYDHSF